jgi:hypothetical protein
VLGVVLGKQFASGVHQTQVGDNVTFGFEARNNLSHQIATNAVWLD